MSGANKRNYRKEYDNYQGKPEQKKRRAKRNAARSKLAKAGKVRKGDGKDVDRGGPRIDLVLCLESFGHRAGRRDAGLSAELHYEAG